MKAISSDVILSRVSTRADGSLGLSFSTPELRPEEKLAFLEAQNLECKMLLQPKEESAEVLVDIKREFETKTPSMRLRAVLFVAWSQAGQPGEFSDWYARRMEGFINQVKQNLLPEK